MKRKKGINLKKLREVSEKFEKINRYIREGKEIPYELRKDFVRIPGLEDDTN